mgnify:CR=1 FL=1
MTVAQEAEKIKKQFEEAKQQIKMLENQLDDWQTFAVDQQKQKTSELTEEQRIIAKMFDAFQKSGETK